jgi:hypothetical protein
MKKPQPTKEQRWVVPIPANTSNPCGRFCRSSSSSAKSPKYSDSKSLSWVQSALQDVLIGISRIRECEAPEELHWRSRHRQTLSLTIAKAQLIAFPASQALW